MADVSLPLVGGVSKKALAIGGLASAAVVAVIVIRRRSSASSAAAGAPATDASGQQVVGYDANGNPIYSDGSGGDYTDPGLQDTSFGPTFGATGYYDPNTGQWVYGNSGTGQAAATTNAQWAQLAEAYLTQNAGADPATLSAALGAYLAGQAVTAAQESLIDQAIAVEGYPPVAGPGGNPPGIRTQSGGGQGSPPPGGKPPSAAPHLSVTGHKGYADFGWSAVSGAADYELDVDGHSHGTQASRHAPHVTLAKGRHAAKVRASNSAGHGPWSASRAFTVS